MRFDARTWSAEAPSNIALIKYMGKVEGAGNRPTNSSLSYTLPHLRTIVELEIGSEEGEIDRWEPLAEHEGRPLSRLELSVRGRERFLAHLQVLKSRYGYRGGFTVRSANDFPSDCGLASSASSFAALTRAAVRALTDLTGKPLPDVAEMADWSRQGSGSSCRSFFSPWVVWEADAVHAWESLGHQGDLLHQVVVVNEKTKAVSSSEAHRRVSSSALFRGRPERAAERMAALISALEANRWSDAFEIAWAEFWDMHALFETSRPSFGYMTSGSMDVLKFVRDEFWEREGDGPLVTMDAGPNVHLLFRPDAVGRAFAARIERMFGARFRVISSVEVPNVGVSNVEGGRLGARR